MKHNQSSRILHSPAPHKHLDPHMELSQHIIWLQKDLHSTQTHVVIASLVPTYPAILPVHFFWPLTSSCLATPVFWLWTVPSRVNRVCDMLWQITTSTLVSWGWKLGDFFFFPSANFNLYGNVQRHSETLNCCVQGWIPLVTAYKLRCTQGLIRFKKQTYLWVSTEECSL